MVGTSMPPPPSDSRTSPGVTSRARASRFPPASTPGAWRSSPLGASPAPRRAGTPTPMDDGPSKPRRESAGWPGSPGRGASGQRPSSPGGAAVASGPGQHAGSSSTRPARSGPRPSRSPARAWAGARDTRRRPRRRASSAGEDSTRLPVSGLGPSCRRPGAPRPPRLSTGAGRASTSAVASRGQGPQDSPARASAPSLSGTASRAPRGPDGP